MPMVFIQNDPVTCTNLEDEGGNEHTKEKGGSAFQYQQKCVPWYGDEGEEGTD